MADLIAKLRQDGIEPIGLRSTGAANIYEWSSEVAISKKPDLDRHAARDVIDALRQGVVPERNLNILAVGQRAIRDHLLELLDHVRQDRSEFKFVRGAYGAGKTFLCHWLREQAFTQGYAIATVRIGPDQPLSDLPVFYSGLIEGLRTPEKRDACALVDVLESWLLAVHRKTAQLEGLKTSSKTDQGQLAKLVEDQISVEVGHLERLDPGFGPALRTFYRARLNDDNDRASIAIAWLRGSRSFPAQALRSIGVRGYLEPEGVFPRMRALLHVINAGRFEGLAIFIDELETVRRFPHARQREQAYETLRLLIDECGENNLPGCLIVATGTDQLFDDERYGLPSYEALADRIARPTATEGQISLRQPIVELDRLDPKRLFELAVRVRDIHGTAYDWPAIEKVPEHVLETLVDRWTSFGEERIDRLPRPFLKEIVHLLDLCEESVDIPAEQFLGVTPPTRRVAESIMDVMK